MGPVLKAIIPKSVFLFCCFAAAVCCNIAAGQTHKAVLHYTVSAPQASEHYFHIELNCAGWPAGTVAFKMPRWTPGYYQLMDYAKDVENLAATVTGGKAVAALRTSDNTWLVAAGKNTPFIISYDVKADKNFVANSYVDTSRGYIIPGAAFLYIDGHIKTPVSVTVKLNKGWAAIATGLDAVPGKINEFSAPDFDILYDCPILMGNLEVLPAFTVNGITHRFIAYRPGNFDRQQFIENLRKVVTAASGIIGDIPYKQYTFIGIGPGRGGIEHLNNTTVSFSGNELNSGEAMNRVMNFLAHEYFHNYNVKRIRPFELGPFDYDRSNRTNLLWVSEGLSVYYEYLSVKRAGLADMQTLFKNFEGSINAFENSPGRNYQSLVQASYETWSDGPFGTQRGTDAKTISYYDKGPAVGLIIDFTIRHATQNKKSLDDVMRLLYNHYYKKLQRGFTDAEFQQACEKVAGISLQKEFEYVYTAAPIDYNTYLAYAGLTTALQPAAGGKPARLTIELLPVAEGLQQQILKSWLGE